MKTISLWLVVIFALNFHASAQCSLPAPASLITTNVGSCQFNVTWKKVPNAHHYRLKYQVSGSATWEDIFIPSHECKYTLTGLAPSTTYKVKLAGVCDNGVAGEFKSATKTTTKCSVPLHVNFSKIESSTATVSWTALCNTAIFKVHYKLHSSADWTKVLNYVTTEYALTGLLPDTTYDVKIAAVCYNATSEYSTVATFRTRVAPPPPQSIGDKNVLIILIDDGRQSSFAPEGGPSFFLNPNISRIAYEGARFALCFPAESQCAPSRASLITGLYPHKTGVLNNYTIDTIKQKTLAQILHAKDYYTGFIGKYHLAGVGLTYPQPGYDYWMENTGIEYFNQKWSINGLADSTIVGHKTDIVTDSTIGFLHKIPSGKSFFLEVAFAAPHSPFDEPREEDKQLYLCEEMPVCDYPESYLENYPSFLYPCQSAGSDMTETILGYYQLLAGVEYSVGRILDELQYLNVLDSTLIIFTSDNGVMFGEHNLCHKSVAYEESMRLPLYMRYPPAIPPGTVVDNDMAMIIDLAPTILDYLDIFNVVAMDGISLKRMIEGTVHRKQMFYEFFAQECVPDIRAVRSLNYKYIQYGCDSVTEEFFDLVNDPKETTNLINNETYESLVKDYRSQLDSLGAYYDYTNAGTVYNCFLENPVYNRNEETEQIFNIPSCEIYPNPAWGSIRVSALFSTNAQNTRIQVQNMLGEVVREMKIESNEGYVEFDLDISGLPAGLYVLSLKSNEQTINMPFIVERS